MLLEERWRSEPVVVRLVVDVRLQELRQLVGQHLGIETPDNSAEKPLAPGVPRFRPAADENIALVEFAHRREAQPAHDLGLPGRIVGSSRAEEPMQKNGKFHGKRCPEGLAGKLLASCPSPAAQPGEKGRTIRAP